MDPAAAGAIGAAVVAAANSAGGEAGRQAWSSLVAAVRRALGRRDATPAEESVVEAVRAPGEPAEAAAVSLRDLVLAWAREDPDFLAELADWQREHAAVLEARDDNVTNTIGGNTTVHGPVIQARDIHGGIDFGQRYSGQ
jgi:hypothetical protein